VSNQAVPVLRSDAVAQESSHEPCVNTVDMRLSEGMYWKAWSGIDASVVGMKHRTQFLRLGKIRHKGALVSREAPYLGEERLKLCDARDVCPERVFEGGACGTQLLRVYCCLLRHSGGLQSSDVGYP